MILIKNIKLLSKVEGLLDRIDTPEFLLKISVDDIFLFQQAVGTTQGNQTVWQENAFPMIELVQRQEDYRIAFVVYRNGVFIGTAQTTARFGQNLKQQNDVINSDKTLSAKILYECQWYSSLPPGMAHVTNEEYVNSKYNNTSGGSKPPIPNQISSQKHKTYVRGEEDQNCGGLCSCFGTRKKKQEKAPSPNPPPQSFGNELKTQYYAPKVMQAPQKKEVSRKPYLYSDSQLSINSKRLETGKNEEPKRLCYYSKSYCQSR